jgi:hypothetical protein
MRGPMKSSTRPSIRSRLLLFSLLISSSTFAQEMNPRYYDIGSPALTDLWVDRLHGNDMNSGTTRSMALATLHEAWGRIPQGDLTATGYRIQLAAGTYNQSEVPAYWQGRHGSRQNPILLNAADGRGTVVLPNVSLFDCEYLYLIGIQIEADGGDALHFEQCRHMLVRNCVVRGLGNVHNYEGPQEAFKANQCQYLYVEDSDISGGWDNAVDFVAVQYGHIVGNAIHRSHEWCMYLKGGSAYFRIEANELYDALTGGFTAGQGTGFEYMVSPWLHYEAYDLKFINNIIHDVEGPGMGVNGGYNILLAHNTLYRVGRNSHALEVVFGSRSCDGDAAQCHQHLVAGGWGTETPGEAISIPNRHVFIYNNLLLNPDGYASAWQHFAVHGPQTATPGSNLTSPVQCDVDLQIRGNLIWNGPADLPLGVEGEDQGCQAGNATCCADQLRRDNTINTLYPLLADPATGNYRPSPGSAAYYAPTFAIPDFPDGDRPQPPLAPSGLRVNTVERDFDCLNRSVPSPQGAFLASTTSIRHRPTAACDYQLIQNHPNPFNSNTLIEFTLPQAGQISLDLYDVQGRLVKNITRGAYAAGHHQVSMQGDELVSGPHWLCLQNEARSQSIKVMVVK